MKIQDDVIDILARSTVDERDNILFLPKVQLDRKLYLDVNKCLESIGGKWNHTAKGHVFDHNPSDDLDEMINTGEWQNVKKDYQYFPTPKSIVKMMIEYADIKPGDILLEPSAGQGNILDELYGNLPDMCAVFAIELLPENCKVLRSKGYSVHEGDFLEIDHLSVDKVIMNPPFSHQQDVKHILHAWKFVSPGGILVSVVSESPFFRENKLSREFRQWLMDNHATIYDLDNGAFRESGTMVKARIIVVHKARA